MTINPLINVLCYAFVMSITPMYYVPHYQMLLSCPSHQCTMFHIIKCFCHVHHTNVLCFTLSNAFVMSITTMYYVSHYQMLLSCPSHQCTMFHIIKCICHVHHTHKHFRSMSLKVINCFNCHPSAHASRCFFLEPKLKFVSFKMIIMQ